MKDENKTKAELIKELKTLRKERGKSALNDITERKKAEETVQVSEEKYRALYDNAPLSYQSLNEDGSFNDVNPAWLRTLGYDRKEVIGKWFGDFLHPDWKSHFEKNFPEFKRRGYVHDVQFKIRHKDGHYLDILFEGCIGYNPDGSFKQTYCVFQDITERKQAESKLQKERDKLTAIFESMTDGVYIVNKDHDIQYVNSVLKRTFGSPEGKKCHEYFHDSDRPCTFCKNEEVFAGKTVRWEWTSPKYGKTYDLIDTLMKNADGSISKLEIFRDITERKRAEEEIKNAAAKWQTTFDAMNDAVSLIDNNGIVLQCNQSYLNLLGKTETEILGKHCWEVNHGTNKPIDGCPFAKMKKSFQRESIELPIDDKWFNVVVDPVFDAYNNLIKAVHIMTDITERKQLEAELLVKNEVFEASITANSTSDNEGILTYVNSAFIKIFGYENKEEAVGKPISDFLKFEDEAMNIITALNETGVWEGEYTGLRKDGTTFTAYGLATIIKDRSGDSIGYQSAVLDISDRKRMEENLRESEEKYSSVVENSLDGIIVLQKGIIKFLNQAILDLTGYNLEEMIDKEFENFLSPEYRKLLMDRYQARLAGEEVPSLYEMEIIRKNGISVPIEVSNTTITYEGKKVILSFIRDITERKQAEEKEREHHKNIELLSETAMQFVEFPQDKDIYTFIGNQLQEFTGKDSLIVVNSIDKKTNILTTRTVIGMGKLSEKVVGLLGRHPIGMTFDAKDEILSDLSDSKLHLYKEGLYGILLKTVPKAFCNSIEKILNIKKIYGIGFTKDNELFGTIVIFLKEGAGELKNKQIIEAFLKQASIAIQRRQAEDELRESEEKFRTLVTNTEEIVYMIAKDGTFLLSEGKGLSKLGLKSGQVVGKSVFELYKDYPYMLDKMRKAFNGETATIEVKVGGIYFRNWYTPHINYEGEIIGLLGLSVDITERKQAEERLKKTMNATIETISKIIEAKDPYTVGHQQRVSQIATAIAKELNLSPDKIEGIRIASLIHDIGKIGIPTEILSKPIALADIEFNLIKDHSQMGHDILKSIEFPWPIAKIVLQHHEKIDGLGYPNNLKGDEILLEAKILGVADVVEAMSSHRPYRPALGIDKALKEISQNKGIRYDPEIVDICLKLFKEKGFKFE